MRGLFAPARGHLVARCSGDPRCLLAGPARNTGTVGSGPQGGGTPAVCRASASLSGTGDRQVRLGSGRPAAGSRSPGPLNRLRLHPSGGGWSGTPSEGRPAAAAALAATVITLLPPHAAGAARPRASEAAVTDGVAAPSSPAAPPLPTPAPSAPPRADTSWKHRRQRPPANQRPPQEGKRVEWGGGGGDAQEGGAGAAGEPGAQGWGGLERKREGGARSGGASRPPCTPATLSAPRTRARARAIAGPGAGRGGVGWGARSVDPPP